MGTARTGKTKAASTVVPPSIRIPDDLAWPAGFASGAGAAGLKAPGRLDVAVLVADGAVPAAAMFTTNLVQAAPVLVCKEHLKASRGLVRAVVANAGNANACTGAQGLRDAREMCALVARRLRCPVEQVLVASTGVIGRPMDMPKVRRGIAAALKGLGTTPDHFAAFSQAICTTDRWRKVASGTVDLAGRTVRVVGTTKGAGMIAPNMATTLAFLATDAKLGAAALRQSLRAAIGASYNRAMVDGHMSTNDFAVLLASGASGCRVGGRSGREDFESTRAAWCATGQVRCYQPFDFSAPIASGSYPVSGMLVLPCSMSTVAAIASGASTNLVQRAADCVLKEGRRLVLVPRESPLSAIHLENLLKLARLGVRVVLPVPAFYTLPRGLDDVLDQMVGRTLEALGVPGALDERFVWEGSGFAEDER